MREISALRGKRERHMMADKARLLSRAVEEGTFIR